MATESSEETQEETQTTFESPSLNTPILLCGQNDRRNEARFSCSIPETKLFEKNLDSEIYENRGQNIGHHLIFMIDKHFSDMTSQIEFTFQKVKNSIDRRDASRTVQYMREAAQQIHRETGTLNWIWWVVNKLALSIDISEQEQDLNSILNFLTEVVNLVKSTLKSGMINSISVGDAMQEVLSLTRQKHQECIKVVKASMVSMFGVLDDQSSRNKKAIGFLASTKNFMRECEGLESLLLVGIEERDIKSDLLWQDACKKLAGKVIYILFAVDYLLRSLTRQGFPDDSLQLLHILALALMDFIREIPAAIYTGNGDHVTEKCKLIIVRLVHSVIDMNDIVKGCQEQLEDGLDYKDITSRVDKLCSLLGGWLQNGSTDSPLFANHVQSLSDWMKMKRRVIESEGMQVPSVAGKVQTLLDRIVVQGNETNSEILGIGIILKDLIALSVQLSNSSAEKQLNIVKKEPRKSTELYQERAFSSYFSDAERLDEHSDSFIAFKGVNRKKKNKISVVKSQFRSISIPFTAISSLLIPLVSLLEGNMNGLVPADQFEDLFYARESFYSIEFMKGASVDRWIELLTWFRPVSDDQVLTFLFQHHRFISNSSLLNKLIERYQTPLTVSTSDVPVKLVENQIIEPIKLQILHFFELWLIHLFEDFQEEDFHCLDVLEEFLANNVKHKFVSPYLNIISIVHEKKMPHSNNEGFPPAPLMPKKIDRNFLLEVDPEEFARQLTLLDYASFKDCSFRDFPTKGSTCDQAIHRFNHTTQWVITRVLDERLLKERALTLRHFILIAQKCVRLCNFNALKAIVGALRSAAIHRLRNTWEMVPKKYHIVLNHLEKLTSSENNYEILRHYIQSSQPPCIPWLGLYFKDLTFLSDAYPVYLEDDIVNLNGCRLLYPLLFDIWRFRNQPYSFLPVPQIQEYLLRADLMKTDKVQFCCSLALEPRGYNSERE